MFTTKCLLFLSIYSKWNLYYWPWICKKNIKTSFINCYSRSKKKNLMNITASIYLYKRFPVYWFLFSFSWGGEDYYQSEWWVFTIMFWICLFMTNLTILQRALEQSLVKAVPLELMNFIRINDGIMPPCLLKVNI